MKRILLIASLVIIQIYTFSQTFKGVVVDESEFFISQVNIINKNRNSGTTSNKYGEFSINAYIGDVISFSYVGRKTFYYEVKKYDTSFVVITLKEGISKLEAFDVSDSRIENVSIEYNDNILDYISLEKNTLIV